ncbi:hypothetical protein GLAREA_10000 [Glarea lozoyensis ATCC 20868]|uniref:CFEM domain-containing protein n=1 Tax=Glarea lozoyensis (strain ATCC 20868 / MF5171) TaxID=1116229 RepID=S3DQM0_GLAL2|nr:uncharacterized protein GLAREA_10000 [Glarea lozoyensis ATCC 20868]EPE34306.1 hypothetical protein GLAREA_10000 [Glarea lozoyensis ATCC 20868]
MKLFTLTLVFTLTLFTYAQDIRSLPQCAQGPVLDAISASGCPLTDIKCICANKEFIAGLLEKIPKVCTSAEVDRMPILSHPSPPSIPSALSDVDKCVATVDFANKLCAAAGVTLNLVNPLASSTTSAVSSTSSSAVATTSSVGNSTITSAATPNSASTTSAAPATSSSAAAAGRVEGFAMRVVGGGLAMAVGLVL